MTTPELNDDFLDLLGLFVERGVAFLLVGAHAMAAHGVARATGDMDLLVRPDQENAHKVLDALSAFGAPIAAHGLRLDDFAQPGNVYQIGLPPRRIDILTSITGVSFEDGWDTRIPVRIGTLEISALGREALIRNKEAAARPKDVLDTQLLRAAAKLP